MEDGLCRECAGRRPGGPLQDDKRVQGGPRCPAREGIFHTLFIYLSIYIYLSIFLSIHLTIYLSIYLSICKLYVYLSGWRR